MAKAVTKNTRGFAAALEGLGVIDAAWDAVPERRYTPAVERRFMAQASAALRRLGKAPIATAADALAALRFVAQNDGCLAAPRILGRVAAFIASGA